MENWTMKRLDAIPATGQKQSIADPENPGLWLIVTPAGAKTFYQVYRMGGRGARTQWLKLGRYKLDLNLDEARKRFKANQVKIADHVDPAKEKTKGLTVDKLCDRFRDEHVTKRAAATQESYRWTMVHIRKRLGRLQVAAVSMDDIARFHHALRAMPRTANYCIAILSKMFNLAERWGLRPLGSNPCQHQERFPETKRERFLTLEELERVLETLDTFEGSPYALAALKLFIFTGLRKSEVVWLRWDQVNMAAGTLTYEVHKTSKKTGKKVIPLNSPALQVLKKVPTGEKVSPYVFPGEKKGQPLVRGIDGTWTRIRESLGLQDVRLHDLRHTFASHGIALGLTLEEVGQLLGQRTEATTKRYTHLILGPAREASEKIGARLKHGAAEPLRGDSLRGILEGDL